MIPTTWLSLPCALARDAMTSCSRVRMVRADWAADEGGGGALVIRPLLTDGCAERHDPRAPTRQNYSWRLPSLRQLVPVDADRGVAVPTGVIVVVGPTGVSGAGALMIGGGGAYLASHAATSDW